MDSYREQIARLIQALARPNAEAEIAELADDSTCAAVKMFVDGNLDKRLDKLATQLEFVAEAFDDFEKLLDEYILAVPLGELDTSLSDGQRMLDWLRRNKPLSAVQADYVACQWARHTVELLAEARREQHVRFQSLRQAAEAQAETLLLPATVVHLNPMRAWARFQTTALLEEDDEPPCDVLLFADGDELATAALELEGQALLNELADIEPCTIAQWAEVVGLSDTNELIDLCGDLLALGVVAVE
jgi:hypothetical protein